MSMPKGDSLVKVEEQDDSPLNEYKVAGREDGEMTPEKLEEDEFDEGFRSYREDKSSPGEKVDHFMGIGEQSSFVLNENVDEDQAHDPGSYLEALQ